MNASRLAILILSGLTLHACSRDNVQPGASTGRRAEETQQESNEMDESASPLSPLPTTEAEWQERLSPEEYRVLRQKGTERAFTGKYWNTKTSGTYRCAACGNELFASDTKFDSGSGWPSFWAPVAPENVKTESDTSLGMVRTEVLCDRCGSHLGHVFDDGPAPTGKRYCINSVSLDLDEKTE